MKKLRTIIPILFLGLLIGFSSCKEDEKPDAPYVTSPYEHNIPSDFLIPENPLTIEGIELGRMLYYDDNWDGVGNRACADCHKQKESFSDSVSNALAHINLTFGHRFLWDGKIEGTLEDIMLFEAKDFFQADLEKLNADNNYRLLFKQAFGVDEISYKELAYALAQFQRLLISAESKYDRYMRGLTRLTDAEENGMLLFYSEKGDCFHCHGTTFFTDVDYHNTGLDLDPDEGRMRVTGNVQDRGRFKTPTLRNIALTPPYMHDGRFKTLEEVIDFYSEGVKFSETVDPLMKQVHNGGLQLSDNEKADLVAFMHCLTDTSFVTNPALSSPF